MFSLRIISFERRSNNLACALQRFLCLFCARFALLKTVLSNRNLNKKGLKIESFLQKKTFFAFFFLRPSSKVTNFNTSPMPPSFENFSLDTLNSEQKPSIKKTGRPGRSTGDDFKIYRSGRVEKILTGSISKLYYPGDPKGGHGPMVPPKYAPACLFFCFSSRAEVDAYNMASKFK